MRESSMAKVRKANLPGAKACTKKGRPLHSAAVHKLLPLERWARQVWPIGAPKNLAFLIGRSLRTSKYRLAGAYPLDLDDIVRILRSEHGYSFLQYMMADASPAWWRALGRARGLAAMRKQMAELQRRLAQAEMDFDGGAS
jgi:hypothetical protein